MTDGDRPGTTHGVGSDRDADAGADGVDTVWHDARFTVDARGRRCPLPIIELARRIHEIDVGAALALLADDPAADHDVPAWCRMRAQDLVSTRGLAGGGTAYLVRRLR